MVETALSEPIAPVKPIVNVLRASAALQLLAADGPWDALLANSAEESVFLTGGWLRAVHEVYGKDREPIITIVEIPEGIIGAGAFAEADGVVTFLGDGPSDYQDLLTRRELSLRDQAGCVNAMLHAVMRQTRNFQEFRLRNVPCRGPLCNLLQRGAGFWQAHRVRGTVAPMMSSLRFADAVRKKSLKRHDHALRRAGQVAVETLTAASRVQPWLDRFFQQHIDRWRDTPTPSLFQQPIHQTFFRRAVDQLDSIGALRFTIITLDNELAAAHLGMMHHGIFTWYKPTYNPKLAKHSPGEVLLKVLIEQAMAEHADVFDFTIGDEPFKFRFADSSVPVDDWLITNRWSISLLYQLARLPRTVGKRVLSSLGLFSAAKRWLGRA